MTENDNIPIYADGGLAELIGVPSDIDIKTLERNFPFINKIMQFGNLSQNEITDIKDDLHASNIIQRSKMTRGEKSRILDRGYYISTRAYTTAGLSLSKDGFFTKRVTGAYKHIQTSDGTGSPTKTKGLMGGLFKGGNNE